MRSSTSPKHFAFVMLASIAFSGTASADPADKLPDFMRPISGVTESSTGETATKNMLALNTGMFELYGDAAKIFRKNILAQHPVILGLFSGAGGRFILYRPGMPPLEAPSVPIAYQLLKSVGHSTMALTQVVGPYLDNPANQSWRGSMLAYRSRMQSALDGLDATAMPAGLARQQPHHPAEQHRLHGRLPGEGHHRLRRACRSSPRSRARTSRRTSPGRRRPRSRIGWP